MPSPELRAGSSLPRRRVCRMCEYCGCQDVAAIAALTREHKAVVNLGGDARRALQSGALDLAAEKVRAISAVLAPHTAVEEGALFPAMRTEFPSTWPV